MGSSSSASPPNMNHPKPSSSSSSPLSTPLLLKLTLLRHGQTTANAAGIVQGHQTFWPLNNVGQAQAKAAGVYLRDGYFQQYQCEGGEEEEEEYCAFWRVYSSDLDRAFSTAKIALRQLGDAPSRDKKEDSSSSSALLEPKETIQIDKRLREYALGAREGRSVHLSWEEAEAQALSELNDINSQQQEGNKKDKFPLREYPEDVAQRMESFLEDLFSEVVKELKQRNSPPPSSSPLRVLLVSHGGFLRTAFDLVMGFNVKKDMGGKIQNASFTDVNVFHDYHNHDCTTAAAAAGKTRIIDSCQFSLGKHVNYIAHLENLTIVGDDDDDDSDGVKNDEKDAAVSTTASTQGGTALTVEEEMNDASVIL